MILEKNSGFHQDVRLYTGFAAEDLKKLEGFMKIRHLFNSAMREISAKLETLDDEFQIIYDHNPIHHIESRLKSPISIADKLRRKGIEISTQAAVENLTDIAGVRVICYYLDDIYKVADMLTGQDDVELVETLDYIKSPKENGYRSLHLVVKVPVYLSDGCRRVAVEVQMRTVAMDLWASVEHQISYKRSAQVRAKYAPDMLEFAQEAHALDLKIQDLWHRAVSEDGPRD